MRAAGGEWGGHAVTNAEMRIILTLALTQLMDVPPATLLASVPWLRRRHIRWCLAHVAELSLLSDEDKAARDWIREAAALLRREQAAKARGCEGGASGTGRHER